MTRARILPSPGKLVDLSCVPDGPAGGAIVTLTRTLWPVVRPLGVDVVTADANWHLRATDVPRGVDVRPTVGVDQRVQEVVEVTPDALEQLFARAGGELRTVGVHYTRARHDAGAELELLEGERTMPVPAEQRRDGTWASGPFDSAPAPITLNVYEQWGQLDLRVAVQWSLWAAPERPEHAWLTTALRALLAAGWRRTTVDDIGL